MNTQGSSDGLRIVTFNVLPPAFSMVAAWAAQAGHRIVLAVTTPGPASRRTPTYREIVAQAPPEVDILITTRLRKVALPLIRELHPDLVVSFSFPYRIPPEIRRIPRFGAVNLHPAPLPAYRGPNPMRMIYDGWPVLGATLHWMDDDFDTGKVLSLHTAPLPAEVTPEAILAVWPRLMIGAFAEGVQRALAGETGSSQDHSQASYAAPFTDEEYWLSWQEPKAVIQRKTAALNLFGLPHAKARIDGQPVLVARVDPLPDDGTPSAPGTVLKRDAEGIVIAVADGALRVSASPLKDP